MMLIGVAVVPLTAFKPRTIGRSEDADIVSHLDRVFKRTGCSPENVENCVKGLISQQVYEFILSKVPKKDLLDTIGKGSDYTFPRISLRNCVECVDGMQRIAAARGRVAWWVVELHCIVGAKKRRAFRKSIIHGSFRHQTKYSGGDIFRLRHEFSPSILGVQLTKSRERCLRALLGRDADGDLLRPLIVGALDSLTKFPGILPGLQLGNIFRVLSSNCDQEIEWYLGHHTRGTWERISDHNPEIYQFVDVETVKSTQGLAPFAEPDRATIIERFDKKEVFRHLPGALREKVKQNILSLEVIIPSLEVFHANMRYLSICSKILWKHVAPDPDPDPPNRRPKPTLWETLQPRWRAPAHPAIERGVNESLTLGSTNLTLAYAALYIIIFRGFALLGSEPPLRDSRSDDPFKAGLDKRFLSYVHHRASELGFSTPKISQGIQNSFRPPLLQSKPSSEPWLCKWRSGKPTVNGFLDLQRTGFIPTLPSPGKARLISPAAMLSDLLLAFFNFQVDDVLHLIAPPDQRPQPMDQTDAEGTYVAKRHPDQPDRSDGKQKRRNLGGNSRPEPSRSPIPSPGLRTSQQIQEGQHRKDITKEGDSRGTGRGLVNEQHAAEKPQNVSDRNGPNAFEITPQEAQAPQAQDVPDDLSGTAPLERAESPARSPLASPIEYSEEEEL